MRMKFTYGVFEKEIKRRTKELQRAYRSKDYFKTVCYLKYLSNFYYTINHKLTDDTLEEITRRVSRDFLGSTVIRDSDEKKVIFYDYFGLAARGLANIYVNALDRLGCHVTWILFEFAPEVRQIQRLFGDRENISFYIIPKKTILERMQILQQAVKDIQPRHIFMYTSPADVEGVGVMSTVQGDVTRYLIDLTDHAFWLGKCALDYVIGFRNYGYNLAQKGRKISPEQIVLLPYYPDRREHWEFEGMPFDVAKHAFVFSGGNVYKIEGDTTYEEMVTFILEESADIYFVYAGNGKSAKLDALKEKYPTRFFQIEERKDLDEILKRAKFFLATYPSSGGLMVQYALQNRCIPMSLCMQQGGITDPGTWLLQPEKIKFVFYEREKFYGAVSRLLTDEAYCAQMKEDLEHQVITEEEFTTQLASILREKRTKFEGTIEELDMGQFLATYRKRADYDMYCDIIWSSRNKWIYRKHPFIVRRKQREEKRNQS